MENYYFFNMFISTSVNSTERTKVPKNLVFYVENLFKKKFKNIINNLNRAYYNYKYIYTDDFLIRLFKTNKNNKQYNNYLIFYKKRL